MTRELDPRRQQMVAALYGELSPEEEREFRESLNTDASLRAEWEELQGTRSFLKEWAVPEPEPRFVFMDPPGDSRKEPVSPGRTGFWNRVAGFLPAPALGFAAVSLILTGLMVAGLRVDRVPGGMAVRFGSGPVNVSTLAGNPSLPGEPAVSLNGPHAFGAPAAQTLTPATLDAYSADMMGAVVVLLQEYQDRQNTQLAYILNGFYEELRTEGRRDYADIRTRVEAVGMTLLAEQTRTNNRIKTLIEKGSLTPESESPPNQNEER